MNCNEFKEKVADLFDKNIDMQTQAQLSEHMDNCPECKAYYEELRETFNLLQPQEPAIMTKAKSSNKLWHYAAAAA
jgi:predicted anti-sigma-YlaC factor YlaD